MYAESVQSKFSHARVDRNNAAQDHQIAAKLLVNDRLLRLARQNLERWIARDGQKVRAVFQEWRLILTRLSRSEIATFLRSDTPMARRLRQSSPFAGLLRDTNQQKRRDREKTRT